ncbi:hypothetical protein BDF20DRAFT_832617 [Mycotypha africana]|uniref:uncharacterized protein n=1 Tax=Mycotypha africana TaxID=64632 RepID=UPI002301D9BC|nr:uncharacterized protein BDF20DRAFT_832617 [Mycotypha africana]KAI8987710.1 hypothetical protein BDF20DRAFT_832617 [Mycotypha africana]
MSSGDVNRTEQEKELEDFRNAWKKEVQQKQHPLQSSQPALEQQQQSLRRQSVVIDGKRRHSIRQPLHSLNRADTEEKSVQELIDATEALATQESGDVKQPVTAMDHYVIAVDNERQGKLGKALDSYRRAFKLDPNIDFKYKKHFQNNILPAIQQSDKENVPIKEHDEFKHFVPIGREYTPPKNVDRKDIEKDTLSDLIEQFLHSEESLEYIPKVDYKPVHIAKLPSEILLYILKYLVLHSVSTIPYFALVCKKFFLLTRDPSIWQYGCVQLFKRPDMSLEQSKKVQTEHVYRQFAGNWLKMFIDRPRIRFDGVYISTCHYIRPGTSDTSWSNQPIHFVTYYRYLRFFPDGTILKHVNTEEPKHVVKLLQRGFRTKQVFRGRYEQKSDENIAIQMKDSTLPQEMFYLKLKIKTTHRGKHNKLVWNKYYSISTYGMEDNNTFEDIDDVDEDERYKYHEYDLKLLKPYFFSPVKSYKVEYSHQATDSFDDDEFIYF